MESVLAGFGGLPFAHRLDIAHVAMIGHSFGGAAALEACDIAQSCVAAVNMDGFPYGGVRRHGAAKPNLTIWSDPSDHPAANWVLADRQIRAGPLARIETLAGTRHFNFTDHAVMFSPLLHFPLHMLGSRDGAEALKAAGVEIRRFLAGLL